MATHTYTPTHASAHAFATVVVAFALGYVATGFLNVCEVAVQLWKFSFSPTLAACLGVYMLARGTDWRRALLLTSVVLTAGLAGQAIGYWKPWICF